MIELMRRIGFPPFKRAARSISAKARHRLGNSILRPEPLEARMLLASDLAGTSGVTQTAYVVPLEAYSLFNALSRGGSALLANAGVPAPTTPNSTDVSSSAPSPPPAVDDLSRLLSTIDTSTNRSEVLPIESPAASDVSGPVVSSPVANNPDVVDVEPESSDPLPVWQVQTPLASMPAGPEEAEGETGDVSITIGQGTFVIYNSLTGTVRLDTSVPVTSLEIVSASGIFTGAPAQNLGGTFDVDTDFKIFKLTGSFGGNGQPLGYSSLSFGAVAPAGLTDSFVRNDLTINGSPEPSGVLSNKQILVDVFPTDLSGNRITSINFGQEFNLTATVKDVRPTSFQTNGNVGVFAAYFDVNWNANLAEAVGTPVFTQGFTNGRSGTVGNGLLDEVGAVSASTSPTNTSAQTLFTLRMRAKGGGNLQFSMDPADVLPQHETLMFGGTAAVTATETNFDDDAVLAIADTPSAPDLVAFAKALTTAGAKMYGAGWCPHCTAQKELFEDGQHFLPFVEVTNPDRTPNQIATDNNITSYPTWVFSDGSRLVGEQTLETLATKIGVSIPQSNQPILLPLDESILSAQDQIEVLSGAPLHVALDGYDPNNGPLTYTVTSDNPTLLTPTILTGNRNLQIDVDGFGKMLFQLFDDEAPRAADRIVELAEDGFYDGLKLHRILNNFVIQGGDPNGNGTGGSDLPDFDDQFDVDLQHVRTGILSMAKSGDDTNNSQFFITEGDTRWLDFNHSIFGQLIEGESNRDNISNVAASGSGTPTIAVTMKDVTVVNDTENALVRLSSPAGSSGSANITVKVRDAEGHEQSQTFAVVVTADTSDGGPFLADIPELSTTAGTALTYQLVATDTEGDALTYSGSTTSTNITLDVNATTGLVTVTPNAGFIGTATATVRVKQTATSDTTDTFDSQLITIQVRPGTPTVDLAAASDSGLSSTDNVTNAATLDFTVTNVQSGATVAILADGQVIGQATATGTSVTISTANLSALGDGTYDIVARQTVSGQASADSAVLEVTLDQTAPDGFLSTPPTEGLTQSALTYDANHEDEGDTGFRYSLNSGPTGAGIDANTGVFTWTPAANQTGPHAFGIVVTDLAGNSETQAVAITINSTEIMSVRLQVSDASGDELSAVATGQPFTIQVFVSDLRPASGSELRGVFAAYVDVNYPASRLQVTGPIAYGTAFANGHFGTTTTAGLVNDSGGTAGTTPLGTGEFLLFSVPMIATQSGTATLTSDGADELPLLDSLLNGLTTPLTAQQIRFEETSVNVVDVTFAVDDTFALLEDSAQTQFRVLDNDIPVPSSTTLTITNVTTPAHGVAVRSSDNQQILYTPTANYQGPDTFTYSIQDGNGNTAEATVTVTVTNVNDAPVATDDTFSVAEDSTNFSLNVTANDTAGPDANENLIVQSVTTPSHGTATISTDGKQVLYSPSANYTGPDSFQYTLSDGNGGTDTAVVTLTVTEVNDAPTAVADVRSMNEDAVLTFNVSELLGNDTAGTGETTQTLTVTSLGTATAGTAVLNGSTITVTPPANFFGTLSFSYTIRDDGTTNGVADPKTGTGTVTINVNNVNDAPTAVADTATTQTGAGSILIDVLANDSFAPDTGETLSVTAVSAGSQGGTISLASGGKVSYAPAANFAGEETFTYTLSDGNGGTAQATVTVTVQSFVPGGISGFTFLDTNGDGVRSSNEQPLSGVKVSLTGTSDSGAAIATSALSDATGKYVFAEVPAGSYTVTQVQPAFTVDGAEHVEGSGSTAVTMGDNSFELIVGPTGTNGDVFNFAETGLEPKFSIWEALASSSQSGFHASVDATEGQEWVRMGSGWSGVTVTDIRFSSDLSTLTITIREGTATLSATVARTDHSKVQVIGHEGQTYLLRIRGARADFNFQPVTT